MTPDAPLDAPLTAAVLTVSDAGSRGEREDTAGPAVEALLEAAGFTAIRRALVPDEPTDIVGHLLAWSGEDVALIVTTGGTGLSPRDRTPEATREVIDFEVPGLAELMRLEGRASTPMAMLSRGTAGVRGRTLILNLPGSEKGARENLQAVLPVLAHAIEQIRAGAGH